MQSPKCGPDKSGEVVRLALLGSRLRGNYGRPALTLRWAQAGLVSGLLYPPDRLDAL